MVKNITLEYAYSHWRHMNKEEKEELFQRMKDYVNHPQKKHWAYCKSLEKTYNIALKEFQRMENFNATIESFEEKNKRTNV